MEAASRHYIHMDELMDAVGRRLAEITQADWGIVTSGCAAALAHATAACVAGADPERLQRLPDLTGMKNEVIAPRYSRNVYDHAVRMVGVRIVEAGSIEEYQRAFNDRTAMVMILAGPGDEGPLGVEALSRIAREKGVPVLVDAAAERLTIPNVHLGRGATMVAYSGGKCLRGPQCAGMLLGPKDLLQAAWIHSAPHHAFGRPMKVGKEEIMGMLAAVEAWVKRDHKAEWKQWEGWLDQIGSRAKQVEGVTTEILQPDSLSNNAPQLRISWNGAKLGVSGRELEKRLADGTPRIILGGASGTRRAGLEKSSITIMPYMMMPGDEKAAAERIHAELASPQKVQTPKAAPPAGNISGQWEVQLQYTASNATHSFVLNQGANGLSGTHTGQYLSGDVRGFVEGDQVQIQSSHKYEGTRIGYDFTGTLAGNEMKGSVDVGEYGKGSWTARRSG